VVIDMIARLYQHFWATKIFEEEICIHNKLYLVILGYVEPFHVSIYDEKDTIYGRIYLDDGSLLVGDYVSKMRFRMVIPPMKLLVVVEDLAKRFEKLKAFI